MVVYLHIDVIWKKDTCFIVCKNVSLWWVISIMGEAMYMWG